MSNPPPPFQVPDDNDPSSNDPQQQQPWQPQQPQYGSPQGDPLSFTPPGGVPQQSVPGQQWAPPPAAPGGGQYGAPQPGPGQQPGQQWAPPPAAPGQQYGAPQAAPGQQWAPPPAAPGGQQYGPPPGQQPYVPPQTGQPQWSGGGGFVDTPAAAGAAGAAWAPSAMPPPSGPPTSPPFSPSDSGPGRMPPPAYQDSDPYGSGPGSGQYSGPYSSPHSGPRSSPGVSAPYAPPPVGRELHLGPPRPRRPKRVRSVLLPSALAAVLVTGLAVPAALHQADRDLTGGLSDPLTKGEVQWSIREGRDGPATPEGAPMNRAGAWFTATSVVVAEAQRVVSYELNTGKTLWEYKSPDGEFVCDVTSESDTKYAVVAFGSDKSCTSLEAVDLESGKKVWSAKAPDAEDGADLPPSLAGYGLSTGIAVSQDVVVFDGRAYKLADGKPLWNTADILPEGCPVDEVRGGARLVAKWSCGGLTGGGGTDFGELDAASGRPKWTYSVKSTSIVNSVQVASVDPVMITEGDLMNQKPPKVIVLNEQGKEAYRIEDGHPVIQPPASTGAASGATPALSSDKVLYVPGSDMSATLKASGGSVANQITAYDRATGKKLWTQTIQGLNAMGIKTQGQLYPIRVEESGDLLILETGGARPMHLLRLSAADGTMTNLKELPGKASYAKTFMMSTVVFEKDGRVIFVGAGYRFGSDLRTKDMMGKAVDTDMSYYRVIMTG